MRNCKDCRGSYSEILSFLGAFANLRKATFTFVMSVCLSVRPSKRNNSAPTERIFIKCDICVFFQNLSRKFKVRQNRTRIMDTLHKDQYTCSIIYSSILLGMRNLSDEYCRIINVDSDAIGQLLITYSVFVK